MGAAGIFREWVAVKGVGARAAAPTAPAPFAPPAAPSEPCGITQPDEERVLAVDRDEIVPSDVAGRQRQEPARPDVAHMIHEHEAVAIRDRSPRPHA